MPGRPTKPDPDDIVLSNLEPKGRTQYFYHHPDEPIPVRDFKNEGKTEPYIEYGYEKGLNGDTIIGAENYCIDCVPQAITSFLTEPEEYLFLVTNPNVDGFNGKQIIGYLRKEGYVDRGKWTAVTGEVRLYPFEHAYPANKLSKQIRRSEVTVGKAKTEEILERFRGRKDITEECLRVILAHKGEGNASKISTNESGGC